MIAEFGHFCLILAGIILLLQSYYGFKTSEIASRAAIAVSALSIAAFLSLIAAYVITDLTVLNVAENSHTQKPLIYKITGVWGNHEGSMLLWLTILTMYSAAMVIFSRNIDRKLLLRALSIQAFIAFGLIIYILSVSNPFERLFPSPINGNGLNPLLQDLGLAFHPPLLYLGYVGFSVAYSFSISALISGKINRNFAKILRPWVIFAWTNLGAGIALGSWWAYYELGWGGWWFWDPVENASLLPWLVGTALLHSLIVMEKRGSLIKWVIFLSITSFALSLLGTFLVRSGILTSVHAFAVDPARGVFILSLLFIYSIGGFLIYGLRSHLIKSGKAFSPISRESSMVINNLFLITAAATILIGTIYPLIMSALDLGQISVGAPYFNSTFVPLMIPMIVLMGIGGFLQWKKAEISSIKSHILISFLLSSLITGIYGYIYYGAPIMAFIGFALGTWLIATSLIDIFKKGRITGLPLSFWGMIIAHAALGIAIIGMVGASILAIEKTEIMYKGKTVDLSGYEIEFTGTKINIGPNYNSDKADIIVKKDGEIVTILHPEKRIYPSEEQSTTETAIDGNIYVALGNPVDDSGNKWLIRLYYHPLIQMLWLGFVLITIGGVLSFIGRIKSIGKTK